MAVAKNRFKCDNYPDGIVTVTIRSSKHSTSVSCGDCSNCGKSFGIMSSQKLEQIID